MCSFVQWASVDIAPVNTTKARQSLHPDFVEDIRNALNDPSSKRLALKNVFERWGHVIATEVVLGAERQMITQATNVTEKTEIHIKYGLETQLKAEAPQSPFEGKTSAGMTEDEMDSFKFALSRASSCFVGGRSDLHGEKFLDQWRQSIESRSYDLAFIFPLFIPFSGLLGRHSEGEGYSYCQTIASRPTRRSNEHSWQASPRPLAV